MPRGLGSRLEEGCGVSHACVSSAFFRGQLELRRMLLIRHQ